MKNAKTTLTFIFLCSYIFSNSTGSRKLLISLCSCIPESRKEPEDILEAIRDLREKILWDKSNLGKYVSYKIQEIEREIENREINPDKRLIRTR
jgi:hypothetical protein